jgi:hypothetical protein
MVATRPSGVLERSVVNWQAATLCSYATAGFAALFFSAISVYRHDRFASGGYDLGIFDQTIWGYSRFQIMPNTVKGIPNLLGDHFHPALMALAPLYWLWDDVRVLLLAQAFLLAASSLPIFWSARIRLGTRAALTALRRRSSQVELNQNLIRRVVRLDDAVGWCRG